MDAGSQAGQIYCSLLTHAHFIVTHPPVMGLQQTSHSYFYMKWNRVKKADSKICGPIFYQGDQMGQFHAIWGAFSRPLGAFFH